MSEKFRIIFKIGFGSAQIRYIFWLLFFINDIVINSSMPPGRLATNTTINLEVTPPTVLKFLRRFGYLDVNPTNSEALYHETAIKDAIRNVQKYGALDQTGILDNATLKLFTTPRCGVKDVENKIRSKRYINGTSSWRKRHLRYFIANWSMKIPRNNIERDLKKAFSQWSLYSRLVFEQVNQTSADIIVGFGTGYHGDNYPFDGPGNILAHAYYPYEMGSWGGDVHFDEEENWKKNSTDLADGVDFYAVAMHELGHSLGLAHSPIYSSIMFPYYKEQSTLDYDDILAMYDIYIRKPLGEEDDEKENFTKTTAFSSTESRFGIDTEQTTDMVTEELSTVHISSSTTLTRSKPTIPNICKGNFDAVTIINGSVFVFKNEYVWSLTAHHTIVHGYPQAIHEKFPLLPLNKVRCIDAAYVRYDEAIVFFIGASFWVYKGTNLIEDTPKPLSTLLGAVSNISKVDAAMVWREYSASKPKPKVKKFFRYSAKNNCTYIFVGSMFWKFDDRTKTLSSNYPKSIRRWPGIPNKIDAAATLENGKTYFFKENFYWLYNNRYVRPERGYPRRTSTRWLSCSKLPKKILRNWNTTISFILPII